MRSFLTSAFSHRSHSASSDFRTTIDQMRKRARLFDPSIAHHALNHYASLQQFVSLLGTDPFAWN